MRNKILILMFLMLTSLSFADYVVVDKDETNTNQKIYGTQIEGGVGWIGIEITTTTTHYNQGTSTTTYTQWWNVRKATTTVYYDGFNYKKHVYPN
jgi:hypothetical protein